VTRILRDLSAGQAVERPATLEDVRAQVLAPERLNAFVFTGFADTALLIAVVGIAGVLAFSVSARTRESSPLSSPRRARRASTWCRRSSRSRSDQRLGPTPHVGFLPAMR
jgi:hypothetical protein